MEFATNEEAHREERRLVEEYRGWCVNLRMPYRAEEEEKAQIKARSKEWYEANKTAYNAQRREARAKARANIPVPILVEDV